MLDPTPRTASLLLASLRTITVAAVLLALPAAPALAFDTASYIRGCTKSCEPGWRKGSTDPSTPAYRMTEKDVKGLCLCTCETMVSSMSPELRDALLKAQEGGGRPTGDLAKKVNDLVMSAMAVCVPKFQHPPK